MMQMLPEDRVEISCKENCSGSPMMEFNQTEVRKWMIMETCLK